MKIKYRSYEYELTRKDVIIDNGSAVWVDGRVTLNCKTMKITKKDFNKMLKDDLLELIKEDFNWVKDGIRYYKIKEAPADQD